MKHRVVTKDRISTEENLTAKRPGSGISPRRGFDVIGRAAAGDFGEDELTEL